MSTDIKTPSKSRNTRFISFLCEVELHLTLSLYGATGIQQLSNALILTTVDNYFRFYVLSHISSNIVISSPHHPNR